MGINFMNGLFGKIANGMCRISMDGKIAIKTSGGYKTYDVETGRLMNCDSFVLDIANDFFFLMPSNHLVKGDIILINGKPHCVIEVKNNEIRAFCFEDSTIVSVVPEHHLFLGKDYLYGKIVSMFGSMKNKDMMKFMMMSQMMGGAGSTNNFNQMLPLMMMGGNFGEMFDGMFDFAEEKED